MPLPGGPADKLGNRYEARWTVDRFLDVLVGRYDTIRLEPPRTEDHGFEFTLRVGSQLIFHQVKRQQADRGHWTLSDLAQRGVLENFWRKLAHSEGTCVFVSTQDAHELRELAERARSSLTFDEFSTSFLTSHPTQDNFADLIRRWEDSDERQVYSLLRRLYIETVGEKYLTDVVENRLATIVDGDPSAAADVLIALALDSVHLELSAHLIWMHIEGKKIRRRQWSENPDVLLRVAEQNARYIMHIRRDAIGSNVIPRPEAQPILDSFLNSGTKKCAVVVTGRAGEGKSNVILQVLEGLQQACVPTLAFRADRVEPNPLPTQIGEQLKLPGSPAHVLAAIAQSQVAVLVIDQLDAVSKVSGRSPWFYECLLEIIEQAWAFPNLRLLLACRKFDLDNDERFRRLTSKEGFASEAPVSPFSSDLVKQVVANLGLSAASLTIRQLRLLSVPLHLYLLSQVAETAPSTALNFATLHELYELFWTEKQRRIQERRGQPVQWTAIIDLLCGLMSAEQRLAVPISRLDDYRQDVDAMTSEHVLTLDGNQCGFLHESLFDYAFARRFAAKNESLVTMLRREGQDLFRRAQVRQVLGYTRQEDPKRYRAELADILTSADVRFHIHWVVFAWLAEVDEPDQHEWMVVRPLVHHSATSRRAVMTLLAKSRAWFLLAHKNNDLAAWLAGTDNELIDAVVSLLPHHATTSGSVVAELLEPHVEASDMWGNRIAWILDRADLGSDRRLFELFLAAVTKGVFDRRSDAR
jgi:hypothetical protein